uniref:Uncharacterized protein n=1 Tax=Nelumbo nucifera TaxID=4432 RepID=A0A822YAH9_NELNU|nr:TPA_asm: hypothetical protein HUJ06_028046 [Nelumbo nucifera]
MICKALRASEAEFNHFLPFRSSCTSTDERQKAVRVRTSREFNYSSSSTKNRVTRAEDSGGPSFLLAQELNGGLILIRMLIWEISVDGEESLFVSSGAQRRVERMLIWESICIDRDSWRKIDERERVGGGRGCRFERKGMRVTLGFKKF